MDDSVAAHAPARFIGARVEGLDFAAPGFKHARPEDTGLLGELAQSGQNEISLTDADSRKMKGARHPSRPSPTQAGVETFVPEPDDTAGCGPGGREVYS